MGEVLKNTPSSSYELCIVHQCDTRAFNRGAIKNIGFIVSKNKYPNHYKYITFVFQDIDVLPNVLPNVETKKNIIKHFYGFNYGLGGLFSITGFDFEKIGGFPNYWGWGFEDNSILRNAINAKIEIDRSEFVPFHQYSIDACICKRNPCICKSHPASPKNKYIHTETSPKKTICLQNIRNYVDGVREGMNNIYNLNYKENKGRLETRIDVFSFHLEKPCIAYENATFEEYNILNGPYKVPNQLLKGPSMKMFFAK